MNAKEQLFAPNPNEAEEMKVWDETFAQSMKDHEPAAEAEAKAAVMKLRYPMREWREPVEPVRKEKE